MKTILVGMNFSPSSDKALGKACDLARLMQAQVVLLHVLEPVDDPDSQDPRPDASISASRKARAPRWMPPCSPIWKAAWPSPARSELGLAT